MAVPETIVAIKNTAPRYLAGVIDQTVRGRFLLKWLQEQGRILLNETGPSQNWNVKAREAEVTSLGPGQPTAFNQTDSNEQLTITHAHMQATDSIDRRTYMTNQGPTQIVNIAETKMLDLSKTLSRKMNDALYTDNTNDSSLITGLRSLMQPHASVVSTDRVAVPSATAAYGGKLTKLGALGGRWSAVGTAYSSVVANDWPEGNGDPQYDYITPKMWQYSGDWNAAGAENWITNGERILRRSRVCMQSLAGDGMQSTLHVLAPGMYTDFLDNLVVRERLYVSDYAKSLGFPNVMEFEGALLAVDYACPSGRGYGLNPMEMALYSVHDQLFFVDGPDWSIERQAYLFLIGFLGNMRWNPKHFSEYAIYVP